MNQHEIRKVALQGIYLANQHPDWDVEEVSNSLVKSLNLEQVPDYAAELLENFLAHKGELDDELSSKLKRGWQLRRISQIDRGILELGLTEIRFSQAIGQVGAVDEALRLCDEFSDPQNKGFINGVLANFVSEK
jgi:N utilization substance protein B